MRPSCRRFRHARGSLQGAGQPGFPAHIWGVLAAAIGRENQFIHDSSGCGAMAVPSRWGQSRYFALLALSAPGPGLMRRDSPYGVD